MRVKLNNSDKETVIAQVKCVCDSTHILLCVIEHLIINYRSLC